MRCAKCNAWVTPGMATCPECGGQLGVHAPVSALAGASSVEGYRRQIAEDAERVRAGREETRRNWFGDTAAPETASAEEPGLSGRRGLGIGLGDAKSMPELGRAGAEDIQVQAESLGVLNLLLLHAGFSPLTSLTVSSFSPDGLAGLRLKISSSPSVVRPSTVAIGDLGSGGAVEPPTLAPDVSAFSKLDEAERGQIDLEVIYEQTTVESRTLPVTVQTANEWIALEGVEAALACAVTPNSPAIADLVASMKGDLVAYQSEDAERRFSELSSVYEEVGRLELGYIGVPPSFEKTGQKILFPDQVIEKKRGCCIDIAVLTASILERVGYNPVIVVIPGHAYVGAWLEDVRLKVPVLRDAEAIQDLSTEANGSLLVWNSTTYFDPSGGDSFLSAVEAGSRLLSKVEYIIDVAACRDHGFKPIPRSVS